MEELPARQAVRDDFARVSADFHRLLEQAGPSDLSRATAGTKWTNEELLFHMLFGYIIVRALLPLVRLFARLPRGAGKSFARLLDVSTGPFDWFNYIGPLVGSRIFGRQRMAAKLERTLAGLQRQCDRETAESLARGMHFPVRWDPFFRDWMSIGDLYRYPTEHYDFHRRQLTLAED